MNTPTNKHTPLQILVTTMNKDFDDMRSLVNDMNIKCDCILRSQCGKKGYKSVVVNGFKIEMVLGDDKGLSKNRNELINISSSENIVFADDDEFFDDGFWHFFDKHLNLKRYDAIAFAICTKRRKKVFYSSNKIKRVHLQDYSAGIWCYTFDRKKLIDKKMYFNERFGSGSTYNHGEDSIFMQQIFKLGKVYCLDLKDPVIKFNNSRDSTWFKGVTKEFLESRATLLGFLHPHLFCFYIVKMYAQYNLIKKGINIFALFKFAAKGKKMRNKVDK